MKTVKLKKGNFKKIIKLAKKSLESDGLVVIPSDTVYVLAANTCSPVAVGKIFAFKGRRFGKGISVFLNNLEEIEKYALPNQDQKKVVSTLLPGYFTVVLKSKHETALEIEAPDGTIGVRVVENEFVGELTKVVSFPVTATSANISGKGPHYSISSFLNTLSEKKKKMLSMVVDAGTLPRNPPSTIVRLVEDKIKILREGVLNPKLLSEHKTLSEGQTKKVAQKIYRLTFKKCLRDKAVVVILKGDLGSGKTVFAQGVGELFDKQFTSPTFVLMDEYLINRPPVKNIYHLDLYRIESEEEIRELKLEEFLKKGNLILIEWGEKLSVFQSLKKKTTAFFWLEIEEEGEKRRKLTLYQV